MSDLFDYFETIARFPFALNQIARRRMTLDQAKTSIHERMRRRNENFLASVERNIYGVPASPYLALLKHAGCEPGDLRASVQATGLEETLRSLRTEGVYVTFQEFKGRAPIQRNGLELQTRPSDFDNPFARGVVQESSSGGTGTATAVRHDFGYIGDRIAHEMITLDAYGVFGAPTILWSYLLPAGPMRRLFQLAAFGQAPNPWFIANGWRDSKDWLKYDALTVYMLFWMWLFGMKLPFPRTVRFAEAKIIAQTIHAALEKNSKCAVYTGIGRALRIGVAAQEAGLDLTGAVFRGGGEPVTAAKVRALENVGARFIPNYAMSESGFVGAGCANPVHISDVHLLRDLFAMISVPYTPHGFGAPVPALNMTSLVATVPKIMLNYQVDDYGIVEERHCGCPLEQYGYTTHIREIYSYSKLVGEGVTLPADELLRIIEEVLPTRFGGTPLDYQLMQVEDKDGFSRLYLLVSPHLNIPDEQEVVQTLLRAMRSGTTNADATRQVWEQANTIQIKRQAPIEFPRGKLISRAKI